MAADLPVLMYPLQYHAFITHCPEDLILAKDVLVRLENMHFKCLNIERDFLPGRPILDNIESAIYMSKRVIMIISNASLNSEWSKYQMLATITDSHDKNTVTLIPLVTADVEDGSLPYPIRLLPYIHLGREPNFFDKLVQCLKAKPEGWESLLPAGNVAHGLAWSYYYGYLKVLLPGIQERIANSIWWNEDAAFRRISRKLFLLFPLSCMCRDTLTEDDSSVSHAGHLDTVVRNRAGTVGREYSSTVYRIVDEDGKDWYFVGEYVTAIHTMYEMELNSAMSGLQTDNKYMQATRFLVTIINILEKDPSCRNSYKIIPYKDMDSEGGKIRISRLLLTSVMREIERETMCSSQSTDHQECSLRKKVKQKDPNSMSRSLLKLFDLNSLSRQPLEMQKDVPLIERDTHGKAKSVIRGNHIRNIFKDPSESSENA